MIEYTWLRNKKHFFIHLNEVVEPYEEVMLIFESQKIMKMISRITQNMNCASIWLTTTFNISYMVKLGCSDINKTLYRSF